MESHLCMQTAWLGSHTPVAPLRRRSCCGRPCRLPTTTGRPTTVGQVFSNPSEDDSSVVDRSNRPSSSPVDAVMFRLAEVLGIVVGDGNASPTQRNDRAVVTSIEDAKERITGLYESSYFFSGEGREADWDVFDDECEFVDGFSSFRGTGRFRRNVSNFGKVLIEPTCRLVALEVSEHDETRVLMVASWIFKARVKWIGSLLAASGDTTYVLQRSLDGVEYSVVQHDERWKTSKSTVLRNMLFNRIKE